MELMRTKITLFNNDKVVSSFKLGFEIVESIPNSENIKINWDNISDIYNKYGFDLQFSVHNRKKGKIISFFEINLFDNNKFFKDIKQWKTPELNMSIQFDYLPAEYVSINQILNYHNSDKAIKYLIEKGLTIVHN